MVGIDIGSTQVKVVETKIKGKDVSIVHAVNFPIKASVLSESEIDQDELAQTIKKGLQSAHISAKNVVASLLEPHIFTRVIETPVLTEKELMQALQWEAERYIPLPLNEVTMDSTIIDKNENNMEVLLVASPTRLLEKYTRLFEKLDIRLDAIENEALSIVRCYQDPNINSLVVDIGGASTNLYIIRSEKLLLVRTIGLGGTALTKALSTEHNISLQQAEEYKKSYGLRTDMLEGQVAKSLFSLLEPLISEINGNLSYFKEKHPEEVISKIVLTGGGAFLPSLDSYIHEKTQIMTVIGNPWNNMNVSSDVSSSMKGYESIFSVATGLAIRELD